MKRRDFLVNTAGLVGVLSTAGARAAGKPCPPPSVSVNGGTTVTTSCTASGSAQVVFTSPKAQTLAPFTIGQAFRRGDIPSGSYITASNVANLQADVKNRWSDGSVKFAVLSGAITLGSNQPVAVQFSGATNPPGGSAPSLATLKSSVTSGQIVFSGGVSGTVDLPTVIGSVTPFRSGYNSGPQMSEWHWRVPVGSDPLLEVWFFIRLYAGGQVEIEMCVENGHIRVPAPVTKSYTVTVSYNGIQRYSAALTHYYQSRWSRVDWYGTDPQITPAHNGQYLISTLLVPNYFWTGVTAADLNAVTQTYSPLGLPNLPTVMGNAGAQNYIGLLPQCDAMLVTSNGDSRAYNAVMAMARGIGTYQLHFRDENTHLPLAFASYPNLCVNESGNNIGANPPSSTNDYTPAGSGTLSTGTWDFPHAPAPGYTAYLLSGRRIFIEQLQFVTTSHYLSVGDSSRQHAACVFDSRSAGTVRGAAWNLRTLAMTAALTPDNDALRAQFESAWNSNMAFYNGMYVSGSLAGGAYVNPFGIVMMYQTNGSGTSEYNPGSGHLWSAAWMQAFMGASIGFAWDMEPTTDTATLTLHRQFRDFLYKHAAGLAGDDTGFNYRRGGPYAMVYTQTENSSPISWCTSWAQIKQIYEAYSGLKPISGTGTLKQHDSDADITNGQDSSSFPEGYWANMHPALAYAVQHGAPGAAAGLARIMASPSWVYSSTFNSDPTWGVQPR